MVFTKAFYCLSVVLVVVMIGLPACGSGSSGTATPPNPPQPNPPDPGSIPSGASTETTLNSQQPTVTLDGIASVTFSQDDATGNPKVGLTKEKNLNSAEIFSQVQLELDILSGADYEIAINTTNIPHKSAEVKVSIPDALAAMVTTGRGVVVYYEVAEDEDQPAGYIPLESTYDILIKTVSAVIPEWVWHDHGNGNFKVLLKLGVTNLYGDSSVSGDNTVSLFNKLAPPTGAQAIRNQITPELLCPLKESTSGCVETSRFGMRTTKTKGTQPHRGMDLRALGNDNVVVHSAMAGEVLRYDLKDGSLIIKSSDGLTILKYTHIEVPIWNSGDQVAAAQQIAIAGSTGTNDAHLHFEVLHPVTKNCKKSEGIKAHCDFIKDYIDPFPSLLRKTQIKRISTQSEVNIGDTFQLALEGTDAQDVPVSSEIDADPGNRDRRVRWDSPELPTVGVTIVPVKTKI